MLPIRSVCVYCGSSPGRKSAYQEAGYALGLALAAAGLRLVYGGGTRGIMGAVADGAAAGRGKILGIIPQFLLKKEGDLSREADPALEASTELVVVENMHQRKHRMFEESDAFVALPGGIGTVEEIIEIMTWGQLGHHRKPMVFASIDGFWDPMRVLIEHMRSEGFVHTGHLVQPIFAERVEDVLPAILRGTLGEMPEDLAGADTLIRRM